MYTTNIENTVAFFWSLLFRLFYGSSISRNSEAKMALYITSSSNSYNQHGCSSRKVKEFEIIIIFEKFHNALISSSLLNIALHQRM